MKQELAALYAELEEVKSSPLEYLPKYGYSPKDEVIQLIEEDINDLEDRIHEAEELISDYELEEERREICRSQGLSRYC